MIEFTELLAAAREGDRDALDNLYERYSGPVLGAIRKRLYPSLRRHFDTMDLAQSVFAEVLHDLPRFRDLGELAFRHWLYVKVEGKIGMKLRRVLGRGGTRWQALLDRDAPLPAEGRSPASDVAHGEDVGRARRLVDALDADQRTLVLLRLEEDLTFAEIADRVGLPSADAARMRYARCLAKIRALWRGSPDDSSPPRAD